MNDDNLIWYEKPKLTNPYIILGFEGWPDAGKVSSDSLSYLIQKMKAGKLAELKPDEFYVFQSDSNDNKRPKTNIQNGLVKYLNIETTHFWYSKDETCGHDLILVLGPEPERNWNKYSEIIIAIVNEYKVEKIVTLGGTFAAIPHSVETRITAAVSRPDLKDEIMFNRMELINYKGPTSIHMLLMMVCSEKNIPMYSLWAHTPHYIQVPNAMGSYHLLLKTKLLLNLEIDLDDAYKDGEHLWAQVNLAIEKKPELQDYLRILEAEYRKGKPASREPISQNVIKEIEDLLKGT